MPFHKQVKRHNSDDFLFVECAGGDWVLQCGSFLVSQSNCQCCLLETFQEIRACPWHSAEGVSSTAYVVAHLLAIDSGDGEANVIGYIAPLPLHPRLIFFHVISESQAVELQPNFAHIATSFCLSYHLPRNRLAHCSLDLLSSPFDSTRLPKWLFQHFLIRTAGPKDLLDGWLQPRTLL